MRRIVGFGRRLVYGLCGLAAVLWLGNSSWLLGPSQDAETRWIAHRGVHQIYAGSDRTGQTCRAAQVRALTHSYIENTLPSIQAAFDFGADVVEIDVHPTTDGHLAVFHDWTLECQTDGEGVTRSHSLAQLQALDLGYGFSVDGQTFPLRGKGVGLLPSLAQVLDTPWQGQVLINFKGDEAREADLLQNLLESEDRLSRVFGVYGGGAPTQRSLALMPDLRGYDRKSVQTCLVRYLALGWSGHVPSACQETLVPVPLDYAPYLWGWPHRFTRRMERAGSSVILLGPWDGSGFSTGIDTPEVLARVPADFDGYIWTNEIERFGPL